MYDDEYLLPNGKTIGYMRKNNMDWWNTKGIQTEKPEKRRYYYDKFLKNIETDVWRKLHVYKEINNPAHPAARPCPPCGAPSPSARTCR